MLEHSQSPICAGCDRAHKTCRDHKTLGNISDPRQVDQCIKLGNTLTQITAVPPESTQAVSGIHQEDRKIWRITYGTMVLPEVGKSKRRRKDADIVLSHGHQKPKINCNSWRLFTSFLVLQHTIRHRMLCAIPALVPIPAGEDHCIPDPSEDPRGNVRSESYRLLYQSLARRNI